MFRRSFFARALGAILFLVLLGVGGFAIHRAGIAQGYAVGLQTAGVEPGSLPEGIPDQVPSALYPGYGWYGYGHYRPFFGGFGFVFSLFFGLMFFFLITRLIFRPFWGWGGGPHAYWKHHSGAPPWAKDWEKGEGKDEERSSENPQS
ncbi:MAG: hypothetical protein HC806_00155 [Anaerolineae bacterium]|nr:hypothetical protein [Anaerolineae bacterium]